ncbi:hypothetical protein BGZ51_008877 [Haplosporangium sp. Z 767]|nr:hypothetical protein BGZ51_008877 [Haplosporangium sp. Z 767]
MSGDGVKAYRQAQRVRSNYASLARLHRDEQHASDTMEQMNSRNDRSQREIDTTERKALYQQRRATQKEDRSYRRSEQPNETATYDSQPQSSQSHYTTPVDQNQRLSQQQQTSEARPRHRVSGRFYVQQNGQYGSKAVKEEVGVQEAEVDEEEVYVGQEYEMKMEEKHLAHGDSGDIEFANQYWLEQRRDGNRDERATRLTGNKPEYVTRVPNRARPPAVRQLLTGSHPEYVTRASIRSQPPSVLLPTSHESDIDQGRPEANSRSHALTQQQTNPIQGHRQRHPVQTTREQVSASDDDRYQFEVQNDQEHQSREDGYDDKEVHSTVPRAKHESATKSRATRRTTTASVSKQQVQPNTKAMSHQDATANLRVEPKATITEAEMKLRFENVRALVSKTQAGITDPVTSSNLGSEGDRDRPISPSRPVGGHYYAGGHMQTGSDAVMSRNTSADGSSLLSFGGERPILSERDSRSSRAPMQHNHAAIAKIRDELEPPEQWRSDIKEAVSAGAKRMPSGSDRTSIQSIHPIVNRNYRDESEGMVEQPMVGSSLAHWQATERSNLERREESQNESPSAVYQDEIDSNYSLRRRANAQRQKQPWTQDQRQRLPQRQRSERHSSDQTPDARHQYAGAWQTRDQNPSMEVMESFEAEESYRNNSLRRHRQPPASRYIHRASISEYSADINSDTSEYRSPISVTPTAVQSSAKISAQPQGLPTELSHAKVPVSSERLSAEPLHAKELARPTTSSNTVTFRGRNYVADQEGFYTFLDDGFGTTSMAYCEDLWEFPDDPRSRNQRVPSTLHRSLEATLNAGSHINRALSGLIASARKAMHPLSTEKDSNSQSEERRV